MTKHLAIFTQPFLDLILNGQKTIESRFGKVKCAPHGVVKTGDLVVMKESGGPVLGEFTVGKVISYANVTPKDFADIQSYATALCAHADPHFWDNRRAARYVTLMTVNNVKRYPTPRAFTKHDRRGWVILEQDTMQPCLFNDTFYQRE